MRTFKLLIISSKETIFDGEAQCCRVVTDSGSMGFEAMHEPMVAILKKDTDIHIRDAEGKSSLVPIAEGILSFKDNTCTITASI